MSTQFLNVMTKLGSSYQEALNDIKDNDPDSAKDNILRVSPYKILNLTGYALAVTRDFTAEQKAQIQDEQKYEQIVIKNDQKVNF